MACFRTFLGISGILAAIAGIVLVGSFRAIFDLVLEKQMVLTNDSMSYDMWKTLPDDLKMYMKIYFFNVTNPEEIEFRTGLDYPKPILEEIGPYTFRERHQKVNEQWNQNGTITFDQVKTWEFVPEKSGRGLSLDDEITTVNIVGMAAAEYARWQLEYPFFILMLNNLMVKLDTSMFMKHQVRNWTFDGIVDDLIDAADTLPFSLPIPYDKFGWFYPRNNSAEYDGTFEMFTGANDLNEVGQISAWKYNDTVESIYPMPCGELTGSAGEFFPPHREQDFVDFFTPDLCRSIRFNFDETTKVNGIPGNRYILDESLVENSTYREENSCYNPRPVHNQHLPNGLLNVSDCKFQAPAYVSYPHFYLGDSDLVDQFAPGSLNPSKEKHESSLSLDPFSGIPFDVKVRMQINGFIRPLERYVLDGGLVEIEAFRDLRPTFVPMIWFETTTSVDPDTDLGLQVKMVAYLPKVAYGFGGSIAVLGVISVALFGFLKWRASQNSMHRFV